MTIHSKLSGAVWVHLEIEQTEIQSGQRGRGPIYPLKPLFHSSQDPNRKLTARTFIQSQYVKELAASLGDPFCNEWKRHKGPPNEQ